MTETIDDIKDKKIFKSRSETFCKLYATNVLVEATDVDLRLFWFNEIIKFDNEEIIALSDGATILTYEAAMLLYEQLTEIIAKWNKEGKTVPISEMRKTLLSKLRDE